MLILSCGLVVPTIGYATEDQHYKTDGNVSFYGEYPEKTETTETTGSKDRPGYSEGRQPSGSSGTSGLGGTSSGRSPYVSSSTGNKSSGILPRTGIQPVKYTSIYLISLSVLFLGLANRNKKINHNKRENL